MCYYNFKQKHFDVFSGVAALWALQPQNGQSLCCFRSWIMTSNIWTVQYKEQIPLQEVLAHFQVPKWLTTKTRSILRCFGTQRVTNSAAFSSCGFRFLQGIIRYVYLHKWTLAITSFAHLNGVCHSSLDHHVRCLQIQRFGSFCFFFMQVFFPHSSFHRSWPRNFSSKK